MNQPPTAEEWFKFFTEHRTHGLITVADFQRIKDAEWNAAIEAAAKQCDTWVDVDHITKEILTLRRPTKEPK